MADAQAAMLTARERLATLGWIPLRSEYFHHVAPPAADVWIGDGAVSPARALAATDGWTIEPLGGGVQGRVDIERLDATEDDARRALFEGTREPGMSDADRFAWAHQAVCRRGLRLRVGQGTGDVVQLVLHRNAQAALEAPTLVIDVAAGVHCVLVETHERAADAEAVVQNLRIDARLGAGARLQHLRVVAPQPGDRIAHLIYASIGRGACYEEALIASGAQYHLQRTELDLSAPESTGRVGGALFASGNVLDQQVEAFHRNIKTRSEVESLMLAQGRARGVINAMCRIAQGSDEAWARQRLSGIPTGGNPKLVLRPHLEICHDNVEAVHGATWGSLPEDAMFYARQRGLDERTARALIVKGLMTALLTHSLGDADLIESLGVAGRLEATVAAYLDVAK
jgi:Fe-S cluster assembly protein SufD